MNSIRPLFLLGFAACVTACGNLTGSTDLPAGTKDPATYETRDGALSMYAGAVESFQTAVASYIATSGRLTDELSSTGQTLDSVDIRTMGNTKVSYDYANLNRARGLAQQALGALAAYAPDTPSALRGHLFALQGYADVLLADLYCSGIPLSTLNFDGDYTYKAGSTTADVYQHAITLFDSALALSADSTAFMNLARVGKARALLQLGEIDSASVVAANVPPTFTYGFPHSMLRSTGGELNEFNSPVTVSDFEGQTGLPYRSTTDPRIQATFVTNDQVTKLPEYMAQKYLPVGAATMVIVASGTEAQLIVAEAALHDNNVSAWLSTLNALRTDGSFTVSGTDTTWGPGIGASLYSDNPNLEAGQQGLRPLNDPGTGSIPPGSSATEVRQNLLFNERAYWLYLTGHRQADLRRLVHVYGRDQADVYPSLGPSNQSWPYGSDVTLPITMTMEGANPLFGGCLSRDA